MQTNTPEAPLPTLENAVNPEKLAHLCPVDRETVQVITAAVCQYYETTLDKILERGKTGPVVLRRQVLLYMIIKNSEVKAKALADIFGLWLFTVQYSVTEIDEKKDIYRQIFGIIENISVIANNLPKKYAWSLPLSTSRH